MKKNIKITINAPVVLGFVLICFLVTLAGALTSGRITEMFFMTYHSSLVNPLTYLRLITHIFGHDGWEHFIGNMSYLLLLGPMLEEKYGSKELIEVIGITAVITGLIHYIFFWNTALLGASGVVFAFILMASFTGFNKREIPLTFLLVAFFFIGQQIYQGIAIRDNISNVTHIVGGLIGAGTGYALNRKA